MSGSRARTRLGVATLSAPKTEDAATLRDWRERHELTQARAAEKLGISTEHVGAIEQGRFRLSQTVRKLMAALDRLARYEAEEAVRSG